jgi:mono/diheme cytochrome c family protein
MLRLQIASVGLVLVIILSACGTLATPQPLLTRTPTSTFVVRVGLRPTTTPRSTNTAAPTQIPTSSPIPPTDTVTPTPALSEEELALLFADPSNGQLLFTTFQSAASFACSTCHYVDREDRLIGPGLFNISVRAATRVEGQSAYDYIITSIIDPSAYIVDDYPDGLMPKNWAEIYTQPEIADIVAYLMMLR